MIDLSYVVLLGIAVSMDGLFAGVAYGLKQVRIPGWSLFIIAVINALCTAAAMVSAVLLGQAIAPNLAIVGGAALLIVLGIFNLLKELRPALPEPRQALNDTTPAPPATSLGCGEAVVLGMALGIDNMIATFAATLLELLPIYTPVILAVMQAAFIAAGISIAGLITPTILRKRIPYLPGAILIVLGLLRLR